jgi:hypothetical protein
MEQAITGSRGRGEETDVVVAVQRSTMESKGTMMSLSRRNNNYDDDASVLSNYNRGSVITQRQVLRACKARGWTLHPAALSLILETVTNDASSNESAIILSSYLDRLQLYMQRSRSTVITANIWNELMEESDASPNNPKKPIPLHSTKTPTIQVISAFEMPKLSYDLTRQQFQVLPPTKTLLGTAEEKVNILSQTSHIVFLAKLTWSVASSFLLDSNARAAVRINLSTRHTARAVSSFPCDHIDPQYRTLEDHTH